MKMMTVMMMMTVMKMMTVLVMMIMMEMMIMTTISALNTGAIFLIEANLMMLMTIYMKNGAAMETMTMKRYHE